MGRKRTFDFSGDTDADREREHDAAAGESEFFIDGWDAYGEWLDELRKNVEKKPPERR